MIAEALAAHLASIGLGTWDPDGAYSDADLWPLAIATMPARPSRVVAVTVYPGPESSVLLGYDEQNVQFRVRGDEDPTTSGGHAAALYSALHGLRSMALPGGLWLVSAVGAQAGPIPMGRDENGRHEHAVNVRAEHRNRTTHRQ